MKYAIIMIPFLFIGCRQPPFDDEASLPSNVLVSCANEKHWFKSNELVQVAKNYAQVNRINFDFRGSEVNVWVDRNNKDELAHVVFSHGVGAPILLISIDEGGNAISYKNTVGIDNFMEPKR
jgi:hypothetical protein